MPMLQLYLMERNLNGEYILKYLTSSPSLDDINDVAIQWATQGEKVTIFTEPNPDDCWKTPEELLIEGIKHANSRTNS